MDGCLPPARRIEAESPQWSVAERGLVADSLTPVGGRAQIINILTLFHLLQLLIKPAFAAIGRATATDVFFFGLAAETFHNQI